MSNLPHTLEDLKEPVNRYVLDWLAAGIVRSLKNTRVMPNQVTYASIGVGLISGYAFSHGTALSMVHGGFFLLWVQILDCVDGQLARAKGCATDWGRLLDGIAGYINYLAALIGMMLGYPDYRAALGVIGVVTILKAVSYDSVKLSMTTMVQRGYDGNRKEIYEVYRKIGGNPSAIQKVYFYYLQVQRVLFGERWSSLAGYQEERGGDPAENPLTPDQRKEYREKLKTLIAVWRWNGVDLPLFLLAVTAISGILEFILLPLAGLLTAQYLLTMLYHRMKGKGL